MNHIKKPNDGNQTIADVVMEIRRILLELGRIVKNTIIRRCR